MLKKINLKNKTALVTGAGKGIGKACAIALAEAGAKVIILSRTKSDLDIVTKIIKKTDVAFKTKIIETLWTIIYSDKEEDMYESNLMRRLSGLLYLDNRIVGSIKEKVKKKFS